MTTHEDFKAVVAVQEQASSYVIGFALGVLVMLGVDVLYYRLTKRTSRKP